MLRLLVVWLLSLAVLSARVTWAADEFVISDLISITVLKGGPTKFAANSGSDELEPVSKPVFAS